MIDFKSIDDVTQILDGVKGVLMIISCSESDHTQRVKQELTAPAFSLLSDLISDCSSFLESHSCEIDDAIQKKTDSSTRNKAQAG